MLQGMKLRRFRLRRSDNPFFWPRRGPLGYLEFAGWLGQGLLWVDGWFTSASHEPLPVLLQVNGIEREVEAQRFCYSRSDLEWIPGAAGQVLVLEAGELSGDPPLIEALSLRRGEYGYLWTREQGVPVQPDLVCRLPEKLGRLQPELGQAFLDFWSEECIQAFSIDAEGDRILRRNDAAVRRLLVPIGSEDEEVPIPEVESLSEPADLEVETDPEAEAEHEADPEAEHEADRETEHEADLETEHEADLETEHEADLETEHEADPETEHEADPEAEPVLEIEPAPSYSADPALPFGYSIDHLIAVDPKNLFVNGWIWDAEDIVENLHLLSPTGERTSLSESLMWVERRDVVELFQSTFGGRAEGRHGFLGALPVDEPVTESGWGYRFEIGLRTGESIEVRVPRAITDPFLARDRIMQSLPEEPFLDPRLMTDHVGPALEQLQQRCRNVDVTDRSFEFGNFPKSPRTSLIVPLFNRLDLVEHQLAQLAGDPDLAACEVIYVLDSPELEREFEPLVFHLSRLYQIPLKGVVLSRNAGYAAAINAGAAHARGCLLVLQHSDVFADRPGWLAQLAEFHATEKAGVVGPKLLYEDESVQHAGILFSQAVEPDGRWSNVPCCQGLPRHHPDVDLTGRVPAVSGACLAIDRELFENLGGLRDQYIGGDYEDVDLCLRCSEEGRECWYLPQVELFHLEGASRVAAPGWKRNAWADLHNRCLQTRIWGERIREAMIAYESRQNVKIEA